jgi:hypothetical protein
MQLPPRFFQLAPIALAASLAGCAVPMTSSNSYIVPLANGDKMEMSVVAGGIALQSGGGIHIVQASLAPMADKKHVAYVFEVTVKDGLVLKHVTVEDMTEDPVRVLADDPGPRVTAGHWKFTTPALDPKDPGTVWITQLDDTIRVFRFTLTLADGHQVVLKQPSMYPIVLKSIIRKMGDMDK